MLKYAVLLLKVVLSLGLLILIAPRLDFQRVGETLLEPATLLGIGGAVFAIFLQSALAAMRQVQVVALFGERLSLSHSLRVWLVSLFVSQIFVTFVAGDVVRAIQLFRAGVRKRVAGQSVVLDRAFGLVILLCMVVASVPLVLHLTDDRVLRLSLYALVALSLTSILAFSIGALAWRYRYLLPFRLAEVPLVDTALDMISVSRFLGIDLKRSRRLALLAFAMHMLNVIAIIVIAKSVGVTSDLIWLIAVILPALLLSMLPISFAGWGVREAAMVTGLGLLAIPAHTALTISLGYGIGLMIASLAGLPALLISLRTNEGIR